MSMAGAVDEPTVLPMGTDVSAKYKGAFCEAKIKKIVRNVKCKLTVKQNNNTITTDEELVVVSGGPSALRVGAHVVVKHNNQSLEAIVNKILDQSLYTVVFDDGDEATLKRTSLCLKSGKHFAESETLDQLPLTNPEHFGNPVSLGRRRRRRHHNSDTDDDDGDELEGRSPPEKDSDWGRVVCVDYGDKRGSKKDIWFPALIVAPTAQDPTTKMTKDEHLVRSFRDGRFYKVNKKDARMFTKETALSKAESNSSALRSAIEKAVTFMDRHDLPNGWDYDLLMGNVVPQVEEEVETSEEFDSALDDSDDEQSEEKDRFVAQLYKYMDERGTPINRAPSVGGKDLNLYKLYRIVVKMGGYNRVTNKNSWRSVYSKLGLLGANYSASKESSAVLQLKAAYKKFLHSFDDFYRKLGCTITVNSRTSRPSRGERVREERPTVKKTLKKEKEIKKEEPKEDTPKEVKEIKETGSGDTVVKEPIQKEPKAKEREKEREKEKESTVKEKVKEVEVKVEEKCKEEPKVKIEDSISLEERKRGRGRKRKEEVIEEPPIDEDTMTGQSTIDESDDEDLKNSKVDESFIKIGDGLKVKYGRGRQQKVYEAKVLKKEMDSIKNKWKYFVHYSGWNSRYDEWIRKSRIVQVLRDRSPRRRSVKTNKKGEPLTDVSSPPSGPGGPTSSMTASLSSQNSVSSTDSMPELTKQTTTQTHPPKRGRPPNSGKNATKEVVVKEEMRSQTSNERQTQPSPLSPQTTVSTPVGRRGRPPLSAKKEKLTRSKSINDDQSTSDSFGTSSAADESIVKSNEDKKSASNVCSDTDVSIKVEVKDLSDDESRHHRSIPPPELHDESTVENKLPEDLTEEETNVSDRSEPIFSLQTNESVVHLSDPKTQDIDDKSSEDHSSPVKDAFDFDDEEVVEEEPLKEQLKRKRKPKDDKKSGSKSGDKNEKKEVVVTNEEVKDSGRTNSFSRKSTKKTRKVNLEVIEKPVEEVVVKTEPPKVVPIIAEEEDKKSSPTKASAKSLSINTESTPQKTETKKRKGRRRKDEETTPLTKKRVKPSKLDLHEEDSNLEVQKLFEQYSSSTPPQESDISPVEEIKVLPNFTNDINPSSQESVSSDFLLCGEAVPASPEKAVAPDDHMDDSSPLQESPQSCCHSSPIQSGAEDVINKESKGGSNSEMENEPNVTKDETNHSETFPSPTHDEDSIVSRPECNKSPISPKKRRRGRMRTTSQSESITTHHNKERIGCKTRGSAGRHRVERQSPLTALEHRLPFTVSNISFHNFIPESKYNFCQPIDESVDADRRINILQERLQELRKTYTNIKHEVANLDRKKKKARKRERERKEANNNSTHKQSSNPSNCSNDVSKPVVPSVPSSPSLVTMATVAASCLTTGQPT